MHCWKNRWQSGLIFCGFLFMIAILSWQSAQPQSPSYETKIVSLKAKADLATVWGNRTAVKRLLMQTARQSQRDLIPQLTTWQQQGKLQRFYPLWITNAIIVEAEPQVINALRQHPAVESVTPDLPVQIPPVHYKPPSRQGGREFTWGLELIKIPQVWRDFGVQGEGVIVGVLDSGIDPNHPDLRGKLRPNNSWLDADRVGGPSNAFDDDGHGTAVCGIIAGGNASGTHIGVAPRASLIVAKIFGDRGVFPLEAMQWVMDPDNNPNTDDGADVVNNSWGFAISDNSPLWNERFLGPYRDAVLAWISARIFPAFSIGNDGPGAHTTRPPANFPESFGIGAVIKTDTIWTSSSRGPVTWWDGTEFIKPDVTAPGGEEIFTSVPGGGWTEDFGGTSAASPHVAGSVALMMSLARRRGVDGQLNINFFKNALEQTSVDKGAPGKDNDYGAGRIDVYEAIKRIPSGGEITPNFSTSTLAVSAPEVEVGGEITYTLKVTNTGADGEQVLAKVTNIPSAFSSVLPLDNGGYDPSRREVFWFLGIVRSGQSITVRFRATVNPNASEQTVSLFGTILARGVSPFTTEDVFTNIVRPSDPYEDENDDFATAPSLGEGLTQRLYVDSSDDNDYFKVNLPGNKVYWIEVRGWQTHSSLNGRLRVYNASQQLLADSHDYIASDPVVLLKTGSGGGFYLHVTADDENVSNNNRKGTYFIFVKDVTPSGDFNFTVNAFSLRAGKTGLVNGNFQSTGDWLKKVVLFNFSSGLRLIRPSQSETIGGSRNQNPNQSDWMLFIHDINESSLSDVSSLPSLPINIGQIWIQEGADRTSMFLRFQLVGRAWYNLSEVNLVVGLDTNLDRASDYELRLSSTQRGIYRVSDNSKVADFVYTNLTSQIIDIGIKWSDINNPEQINFLAKLTDTTIGCTDQAPDTGWVKILRGEASKFGVSPSAGIIPGGRDLPIQFIADAQTSATGSYPVDVSLSETTLLSPPTRSFNVTVTAGSPAQIRIALSETQVPATRDQVTVTATVKDVANNAISGQAVLFTLSSINLGHFNGRATTQVETDQNGQASAVITLTGQVGNLDVQSTVVGTDLFATERLTIVSGDIAQITLEVFPNPISAGNNLTVRGALRDARGNPIARQTVSFGVVPVQGQPFSIQVTDGSPQDEDRSENGIAQTSFPVGNVAGTMTVIGQSGGLQSNPMEVIVSPRGISQIVFIEPSESSLNNSIRTPIIKRVRESITIKLKVMDDLNNQIPSQPVTFTFQQGFSAQSETKRTDQNGEVTFVLQLSSPSTYKFWLTVESFRRPEDFQKTFKVQALPTLSELSADKVRGFGLPFLPPSDSQISLSQMLGIDSQVLQNRIVKYNTDLGRFEFVDPNQPFREIGTGFFVKPNSTVSVQPTQGRLPEQDFVELNLKQGWNLISFPIVVSFSWNISRVQVRVGSQTEPLDRATDVVSPFMWRWDSDTNAYRLVYDETKARGSFEGTIQPWSSYFINAKQSATLIVPVPVGARHEHSNRLVSSDWKLFTLTINQEGSQATTLLLGISGQGRQMQIPIPPSPVGTTKSAIIGDDGSPLGVSIRSSARKIVWQLLVRGKAVISGGDLSALPKEYSLTLIDPIVNERRSLRTGNYHLNLGEGESRRLLVIAEQQIGLPLRVQNLRTIVTRGRSVNLEFTLTKEAETEVIIQSVTGRKVKVLDKRYREAGTHRLVWNGTDEAGASLPKGIYLVQVFVTNGYGEVAQAVAPLRLTR